jgi:sugar phosphate permease
VLTSLLRPVAPGTGRRYYGWRMVLYAALALGATAPGQTAGVSVFVDPMIASLELTRSQLSTAYLVGTLAGAVSMPWFGQVIDRRGVRASLTVVGALFGLALAAMSGVVGLLTLMAGFVGIRMFGQGALGLVATTSVAYWFDLRRGTALGVTSALGQAILSIAPLALGVVVAARGWRASWVVAAVVVTGATLAVARFGIRDRPQDVGQRIDGVAPDSIDDAPPRWGVPRREAMRTLMFWAITGGVVTTGLIGTGLAFHQISVLGEQGLTSIEAAANFIPQTVAGLLATLVTGTLVDRIRPRTLIIVSMLLMASAVLILPGVSPGWTAAAYGAAIGAAGGSARALEAAAFPRFFGTGHLGAIRGVVKAAAVAGTAFGPILLAVGHDLTGSYLPVLRLSLVLPAAVILLALLAPIPVSAGRPVDR